MYRELRTTIGEIERFKRSPLYHDIRRELLSWARAAKSELFPLMSSCTSDNPPPNAAAKLAYIAGRLETLEYLMDLLDNFTIMLKEMANARHHETD